MSIYCVKLNLKVFTPLHELRDLLNVQHVKELEHADFPVLNLPQKGESEDADQGYHSNRDETDEIHEELRLIRSLDGIRLDQGLLEEAQGVKRRHPVVIEVKD